MNADTPHALAQRCAERMFQQDACAQAMGMQVDEVDAGFARVSMTVGPQMLNGHQTCHGGQLFSLADTAFAYACNSQGLAAVASGCSIDLSARRWRAIVSPPAPRCAIRAKPPGCMT
ncbi:Acyl-coenzyme A thioesterase PaaI [Serratia inhibens PRI-2C]|nr:Acyl-coenzyme A thioesterase PaaI [Serratia inhibens PRI-2C]